MAAAAVVRGGGAPTKSAPADVGYVTDPVLKWMILFTASLGALLEVIDTSIVNVALTDIQASLGATLSEVGWVVTSYSIANVIILPMTAWLGDRFGKKSYFIFSLVAFTLSSMMCGVATSLPVLVVARVLQGLGGGGLLAKAQSIIFETFPKEEQGTAQGIFGICVIAGPAIGPTLGGWLTTNIGWRWIFFINLPVGIAATLMAITFLRPDASHDDGHAPDKRVDWLGIFLLAAAVGSFQTVLEQGNEDDWFSSKTIVFLSVVAVLGTITFVWRQLTVAYPVVDLRILRYRSLAAGSMLSLVVGIALYGALFAVPIFAQSILGMTAEQTGWLLFPGAIASAVMMPIVGKIPGDARLKLVVGGGILLMAIVMLSGLTPLWGADELYLPLIVRGIGTVMMYLPLTLATIGPIPKRDVSAATGFYSLTRQLGGSIGIAILTLMLDERSAFHRNVLIEKLASNDPSVLDRVNSYVQIFVARGVDLATAKQQAMVLLDAAVNRQAGVLAYGDSFLFVAGLLVVTTPLVFFLGSGQGAKMSADAH